MSCLPDVPGGGPAPKALDNPSLVWPQARMVILLCIAEREEIETMGRQISGQ